MTLIDQIEELLEDEKRNTCLDIDCPNHRAVVAALALIREGPEGRSGRNSGVSGVADAEETP